MKTITLTDEDYKVLMELSKELQAQEHDSQAAPRFWSPRSTVSGIGTEDDEKVFILDEYPSTAKDLFEDNDLREDFLKKEGTDLKTNFKLIDLERWEDFLEKKDYYTHYRRENKVIENNFSLFKSDVKNFIQFNRHHLGKNPHTFASTIFRMSKMEKLVKCLYRLTSQNECGYQWKKTINKHK